MAKTSYKCVCICVCVNKKDITQNDTFLYQSTEVIPVLHLETGTQVENKYLYKL